MNKAAPSETSLLWSSSANGRRVEYSMKTKKKVRRRRRTSPRTRTPVDRRDTYDDIAVGVSLDSTGRVTGKASARISEHAWPWFTAIVLVVVTVGAVVAVSIVAMTR